MLFICDNKLIEDMPPLIHTQGEFLLSEYIVPYYLPLKSSILHQKRRNNASLMECKNPTKA